MALNKAITNQLGVTTTYHKIRDIELRKIIRRNFDNETKTDATIETYSMDVKILSYVSEDVRQESESYAADRRQLILHATPEEIESTPCFEVAYNKIKELETFQGAVDC